MRITSGLYQGTEEVIVVTDGGVYRGGSLRLLRAKVARTMGEVLSVGDRAVAELNAALHQAQAQGLAPDDDPDAWLAPVPHPAKVICVGLNYQPHVQESGQRLPDSPVLFPKYASALVGSGATVRPPAGTRQLDYEAELVLVIGRTCHQVSESEALDYVLGYCNGNDISARDLQFRTGQWFLGKACDGFGPIGPYLVTRDEVPRPDQLHIEGRRNGKVVQTSNTAEMIFSCAYLVSYISQYITLVPGDVIFTGTPEGVVLGYPESQRDWLKPGEKFTVAVEGLGELVTHIGESR